MEYWNIDFKVFLFLLGYHTLIRIIPGHSTYNLSFHYSTILLFPVSHDSNLPVFHFHLSIWAF